MRIRFTGKTFDHKATLKAAGAKFVDSGWNLDCESEPSELLAAMRAAGVSVEIVKTTADQLTGQGFEVIGSCKYRGPDLSGMAYTISRNGKFAVANVPGTLDGFGKPLFTGAMLESAEAAIAAFLKDRKAKVIA